MKPPFLKPGNDGNGYKNKAVFSESDEKPQTEQQAYRHLDIHFFVAFVPHISHVAGRSDVSLQGQSCMLGRTGL